METASCKKVMHIRAAQVSRGHKIMFKNTQEKGEVIHSSVYLHAAVSFLPAGCTAIMHV